MLLEQSQYSVYYDVCSPAGEMLADEPGSIVPYCILLLSKCICI